MKTLNQLGISPAPWKVDDEEWGCDNEIWCEYIRDIIVKREKVCDNCKLTDSSQIDEMTLFDFLNQLPVEQQKAALVHLSVKWAMEQAGVNLEN